MLLPPTPIRVRARPAKPRLMVNHDEVLIGIDADGLYEVQSRPAWAGNANNDDLSRCGFLCARS